MTRKRFTERQVIDTLIMQGAVIRCFRCKERIWTAAMVEREHICEIALGGADAPGNCAYSCADCHSKITNGSKATTAGSSKQRIAKVRRILANKPSKRPMKSSGHKIPSRPFPKRAKA